MEMFCPDCMNPLVVDGENAHCHMHNKSFRILFCRHGVISAPSPAAAQGLYDSPAPQQAPYAASSPLPEFVASAPPLPVPTAALAAGCMLHPQNPAVAYCSQCRGPVCATCDFAFPGGLHYCPSCATNPRTTVSASRKSRMYWSICLASVATMGVGVLIAIIAGSMGKYDESVQVMDVLFTNVALLCSLIGMCLGIASREKNTPTPPLAWAGIIWNGIILVVLVLGMISSAVANA